MGDSMNSTAGGRADPFGWLIGVAAAVVLAAVPGCGESHCAILAVECLDEIRLKFEPGLRAQGTYEIVLELDGERITCRASIPRDTESEGCESDHSTSPWRPGRLEWVEPPDVLTALRIVGRPGAFQLLVNRDGTEVVKTTVEPVRPPAPRVEECEVSCPPIGEATVATGVRDD